MWWLTGKYRYRFFADDPSGEVPSGGAGEDVTPEIPEAPELPSYGDDGSHVEFIDPKEQVEKKDDQVSDRLSVITALKEKIFGKKEPAPDDGFEEDISSSFIEAARNTGWDDTAIIELANQYTNEELEEMIPFLLDDEDEQVPEETVKKKDEPVVKLDKVDDKTIQPYIDQIKDQLEKAYQEKIKELEGKFQQIEQDRSAQEAQTTQALVDKFFDSASKDFPEFGSTKDLPRYPKGTAKAGQLIPKGKAYEARDKVFRAAYAFQQMGNDWETALSEAMDWYRGKTAEASIRSKVVKQLKDNEKRLSPKRTEHAPTKQFKDGEEERKALIQSIARQAGINV